MMMKPISSIAEYKGLINKLRGTSEAKLVFRGQGDSNWIVQSTLERSGISIISCAQYYKDVDRFKPEVNSLGYEFEKKVVGEKYSFNFSNMDSIIDGPPPDIPYLAYLRHHGFPTPLVDVTQSEYVALFFACESIGLKKKDGKLANAKVFIISKQLSSWAVDDYPILKKIGHCFHTDKRHDAQKSEYVIPMRYLRDEWHFIPFSHFLSIEPLVEQSVYGSVNADSLFIKSIEIAGEAKKSIMAELDQMGINHYSLYGGEDALVQKLKYEYLREKNL